MTRLALIAALLASPAFADDTWAHRETSATLRPTQRHGAVAEVVFVNRLTHGAQTDHTAKLDLGGFGVTAHITFRPYHEPDMMTLTVPQGYVAHPAFVDVGEGDEGVIYVFSADGAGS